jgi:anti-anti-sigma regulatory factor
VLELLTTDSKPIRLAHLGPHTKASGIPPVHPEVTSFLGVPIKVRDEVYGILYLSEKGGRIEVTDDDEALVEALAPAAGVAIENALLHQRLREAAVHEDRDRLARHLQDMVIRRLFAIDLELQSMAGFPTDEIPPQLSSMVSEVDDAIRQSRSAIFDLEPDEDHGGPRPDQPDHRQYGPPGSGQVQVVGRTTVIAGAHTSCRPWLPPGRSRRVEFGDHVTRGFRELMSRPPLRGACLSELRLRRAVVVADACGITAIDPALELTLVPTSLRCTGMLSTRIRGHVMEVAEMLLERRPPTVTIDVSGVYVADVDGADAFARLQKTARETGVELRWVGLESDRLRGLHPLGLPARMSQEDPVPPQRCVERRHRHPSTLSPIA